MNETPVQYLVRVHTPEELARQLWDAVKENNKLKDRNLKLEVENFWLTRTPINPTKEN